MYRGLREAFDKRSNTSYITDADGETTFYYCVEQRTGITMAYEDKRGTIWELDEKGMPDKHYGKTRDNAARYEYYFTKEKIRWQFFQLPPKRINRRKYIRKYKPFELGKIQKLTRLKRFFKSSTIVLKATKLQSYVKKSLTNNIGTSKISSVIHGNYSKVRQAVDANELKSILAYETRIDINNKQIVFKDIGYISVYDWKLKMVISRLNIKGNIISMSLHPHKNILIFIRENTSTLNLEYWDFERNSVQTLFSINTREVIARYYMLRENTFLEMYNVVFTEEGDILLEVRELFMYEIDAKHDEYDGEIFRIVYKVKFCENQQLNRIDFEIYQDFGTIKNSEEMLDSNSWVAERQIRSDLLYDQFIIQNDFLIDVIFIGEERIACGLDQGNIGILNLKNGEMYIVNIIDRMNEVPIVYRESLNKPCVELFYNEKEKYLRIYKYGGGSGFHLYYSIESEKFMKLKQDSCKTGYGIGTDFNRTESQNKYELELHKKSGNWWYYLYKNPLVCIHEDILFFFGFHKYNNRYELTLYSDFERKWTKTIKYRVIDMKIIEGGQYLLIIGDNCNNEIISVKNGYSFGSFLKLTRDVYHQPISMAVSKGGKVAIGYINGKIELYDKKIAR